MMGEIFKEDKSQFMMKRFTRQVRQDFIKKELKKLLHYKEILMNIDSIKDLSCSNKLARKIHWEMKTNYYNFNRVRATTNESLFNFAQNSPHAKKSNIQFESSIANLSNTLGMKTQKGIPTSILQDDPDIILKQNMQLMVSYFDDSFLHYQNRFIKTQGACLHFLNVLNLEKRFQKMMNYNFHFAKKTPTNVGISFFDPIICENIHMVFFPKDTDIPTKRIYKSFFTKNEVIKLKIVEGDSFLSCNTSCIEEFEVKLNDVIDDSDGFSIEMKINEERILSVSIYNKKKMLFQIRLLYRVRYSISLFV